MSNLFSAVADIAAARSARLALRALRSEFGESGLVATAQLPGLLAAVDQHAAAVRDSLFGDLRPLGEVALAGYAHGISEAAREYGWRAPEQPVDWATADWVVVRLLAVCALAEPMLRPADA